MCCFFSNKCHHFSLLQLYAVLLTPEPWIHHSTFIWSLIFSLCLSFIYQKNKVHFIYYFFLFCQLFLYSLFVKWLISSILVISCIFSMLSVLKKIISTLVSISKPTLLLTCCHQLSQYLCTFLSWWRSMIFTKPFKTKYKCSECSIEVRENGWVWWECLLDCFHSILVVG